MRGVTREFLQKGDGGRVVFFEGGQCGDRSGTSRTLEGKVEDMGATVNVTAGHSASVDAGGGRLCTVGRVRMYVAKEEGAGVLSI